MLELIFLFVFFFVSPQVMFVHHRLPSRHMEPRVVRLHHPHGSAQLHGGEGTDPRQHRDL